LLPSAETNAARSPALAVRVEWPWLVTALAVCVLFVPARIYVLPVDLPFEFDAYRAVLLTTLLLWVFALLGDPEVRLRTTGLEGPLALFGIALVGSLAANPSRVELYGQEVVKTVAIFASLGLTLYFSVSVVRRLEVAETVLRTLVLGGAVLGVLAVFESRTGWTPFRDLEGILPFLEKDVLVEGLDQRGANFRAAASAEHPIALGALLAMLAPLSAALAIRARSALWWVALVALLVGAVSTVSRTAVVMLVVAFALFFALRWDDSKRFIPFALAATIGLSAVGVPGTLTTLRQGLAPSFIAVEQRSKETSLAAGGRITDLAPSVQEFRAKPLFGYGSGTRIVFGERANARILDNQWLASLLNTGLMSVIALAWFFGRYVTRLARASASAQSRDAALLAGLAASAFAYAVGMFMFDAFSFVQVTLVFVLLVAVGCSLALTKDRIFESLPEPVVAPRRARRETLRRRLGNLRSRRRTRVDEQLERIKGYQSGRHGGPSRE
jgi:hypothetical protein